MIPPQQGSKPKETSRHGQTPEGVSPKPAPMQPACAQKPYFLARRSRKSRTDATREEARRALAEINRSRFVTADSVNKAPITRPLSAAVLHNGTVVENGSSQENPEPVFADRDRPGSLPPPSRTPPAISRVGLIVMVQRTFSLTREVHLFRDIWRFLTHPGAYLWFQRTRQGQPTLEHDAMAHVVRRFGAHIAVLSIAILVVVFGGFGALIRPAIAAPMEIVSDTTAGGGTVLQLGSEQDVYLNTLGLVQTDTPRRTQVYTMKKGDSLTAIAAKFSINMDTLLYANHIFDPDQTFSEPDHKLAIPPVNGMLHIVERHIPGQSDETIQSIAEKYQVDPKVIRDFPLNNLTASSRLVAGQEIMVPGGKRPPRDSILNYIVKPGDSLRSIAAKFGLDVRTIVENNDLTAAIQTGDSLIIPQGIGLVITGKKTQTINDLAWYFGNISPDNIRQYPGNQALFDSQGHPRDGVPIFIPGGVIPTPTPTPVPTATPRPTPTLVMAPSSVAAPVQRQGQGAPAPANSGLSVRPGVSLGGTNQNRRAATPIPQPISGLPNAGPLNSQVSGTFVLPTSTGYVAPHSSGTATGRFIWPLTGVITTPFWPARPGGAHMGIDIATTSGTPIRAADGGVVTFAAWSIYGYGNFVVIDHGNGFVTKYAHLSGFAVAAGQRVDQGQTIGYEGTTGNSTGPHLHFELHYNNAPRNPMAFLP